MKKMIAVLPGDGIGPEVTAQAIKALEAVADAFGHEFSFESGSIGAVAIDETGDPYPEATATLCQDADAILFGAIGDPKYDNDPNAEVRPETGLLRMRKELGLYANIRPVKSYPSLLEASPLKTEIIGNVDLVVYRELTGGIYFGKPQGRSENGDSAYDTCTYTKDEIVRIAKHAFDASANRRGKLTLVDKANVLATSRLWRETVKELSKDYPAVEVDFMFVDNAAMKIISEPARFDVILTENMFGDILSDEASVITGSLGMLPSASIGSGKGLFEPVHGSYPEVAGQDRANPIASILSAAMLLDYLFLNKESACVRQAVEDAINEGTVTEDINAGRSKRTSEVGARIAEIIKIRSVLNVN